MLDNQHVFAAAQAVISVVDEDRRSPSGKDARGGYYTLEGAVADILFRHLDRPFEHALQQAVEQARRQEIGMRVGHIDPRDLADGDWYENKGGKSRAEKLQALFAQAMEELEQLTSHQCEFTESDHCITCGCDGRA